MRLIEEARVGLSPGYLFGDAAESFLRMCVFRDSAEIGEALDRIVAALQ
jgi:bifunctional pyridoxal-dependent enzyme with beta-cystathionase and maltose regulon repressor activities